MRSGGPLLVAKRLPGTALVRRQGPPLNPAAEGHPVGPAGSSLDVETIIRGRLPASRIVLLLDYDGTLVPIADTPGDATPDPALLNLLALLAAHPNVDLHVVTGRALRTVHGWFRHLDASLWAEHGAAYRRRGDVQWQRTTRVGRSDLRGVLEILEHTTRRTPGALIEVKSTAAAWHYRLVDQLSRAERVCDVRRELVATIDGGPLELLSGRMVLEVRPRGVSKAAVVDAIRRTTPSDAVFVAIGDDETDEEMFAALPYGSVAIHVGSGASIAPYSLGTVGEVRAFLRQLCARPARRRARGPETVTSPCAVAE